jgi:hypothetical protein
MKLLLNREDIFSKNYKALGGWNINVFLMQTRVSFETSFDSKQPKTSFGTIQNKTFVSVLYRKERVSVFRLNQNKLKRNGNSVIEDIFWYFFQKI